MGGGDRVGVMENNFFVIVSRYLIRCGSTGKNRS